MLFGHGLDIEQTEAVALHVVQIAGGNAVELIEYVALLFGSDTCSTVADGDFNKLSLSGRGGLPATDVYVCCFGRVFYGIVNQVADDVAEVRTVCREGKSGRLDVRRDMHGLLRLQFMLLDKRFENAFHGQRFRMQAEGLAAFHAHGEYLLDKSAEPLQLLLADAQILVALCLFFRLVKVQQGIVGGIGYGDRGFQFVVMLLVKSLFISSSVFCCKMVRISIQNAKQRMMRITNEVVRMPDICFSTNGVTGSIQRR